MWESRSSVPVVNEVMKGNESDDASDCVGYLFSTRVQLYIFVNNIQRYVINRSQQMVYIGHKRSQVKGIESHTLPSEFSQIHANQR